VVALAIVACIAERASANFGNNLEASVSMLATVFAAVLFGPLEALLVAAASMLQAVDAQFDTCVVAAFEAILLSNRRLSKWHPHRLQHHAPRRRRSTVAA
jgi:hypothetical protein